ncbi:MAG: hypothetical protein OXU20_25385 [Myxococcales bacterium]|nr:hypothetical protein [Myxococcales bacterium]MDD9965917.1 hypothetical protein [Myxococcales bacterium]
MSARDEFLQYLGAAGGTVLVLFLAQAGLRSCIDHGYHDKLAERPASQALVELRKQEAAALSAADIEGAMAKVAKGRQSLPSIRPKASDDLSAMSGWIHSPNHTTYEPKISVGSTAGAESAPAGAGVK